MEYDQHTRLFHASLLNSREAADYLKIKPGTLKNWRWLGKGPCYLKVGRKSVRYRREDLDAFIKSVER